jgi:hypothetical protein
MVPWIKKLAMILGSTTFFAVVFISLMVSDDPFELFNLLTSIIKGLIAAGIFWFAGIIIGDIFFKSVLTDVEPDKQNFLEGGLLQRVQEKIEKALPGGPDMPITEEDELFTNVMKTLKKK